MKHSIANITPAFCPGVKHKVPLCDAEDVTQIIFIGLMENLHKFKGKSKFETWLRSIEMNKVADYYRSAFRNERRVEFASGANSIAQYKDYSPFISMITEEILAELPELYREVLHLKYWHGLSFTEIAAEMDISYEAVRSRHRRAIKACRKLMEDEDEIPSVGWSENVVSRGFR